MQRNESTNIEQANTYLANNKYGLKDLDDGFSMKKTKIFAESYKWRKRPVNLLTINTVILKSLYYNQYHIWGGISNQWKKKTKDSNKAFKTKLTTKNVENLKILLNQLPKKNAKKELVHRKTTKFNFNKNLKKQFTYKEYHAGNLSVLKRKNFFKKQTKVYGNDSQEGNENENSKISILDKFNNKKKPNKNDIVNIRLLDKIENAVNVEDIYFELVKLIMEGKTKRFIDFYKKNRRYIDINQEIYDGNTLLILCVKEGNYHLTKFLCQEEIQINRQDDIGNTALHYAIGKQFYAIADILSRHGAREDIKNNNGYTPWDCIGHNIE